jgi:GTPase SAR1 family protein
MVCYDSTNQKSFESLAEWLNTIEHYGQKGAHKILIATKTDLTTERTVDFRSATEFSKERQLEIFETSSTTNQRVNEAFMALVRAVWEK